MRFTITTHATPEQVLTALTDFTDRRTQIWNRTLDPRTYEVRAQGDTWAVARESTPGSPFWVVCRYDWSDPALVRWAIEESSWGGGGDGSVRIAPADTGSRVHAEWTFTGATRPRDRILIPMIHRFPVRNLIARLWRATLDRHAESEASA